MIIRESICSGFWNLYCAAEIMLPLLLVALLLPWLKKLDCLSIYLLLIIITICFILMVSPPRVSSLNGTVHSRGKILNHIRFGIPVSISHFISTPQAIDRRTDRTRELYYRKSWSTPVTSIPLSNLHCKANQQQKKLNPSIHWRRRWMK